MTDGDDNEEVERTLIMPFWIDTPSYTDRDREMFVCGAEFEQMYNRLKSGERGFSVAIHVENASRVRMMCGRLGIPCEVRKYAEALNVNEDWSELVVPE